MGAAQLQRIDRVLSEIAINSISGDLFTMERYLHALHRELEPYLNPKERGQVRVSFKKANDLRIAPEVAKRKLKFAQSSGYQNIPCGINEPEATINQLNKTILNGRGRFFRQLENIDMLLRGLLKDKGFFVPSKEEGGYIGGVD